MTEMLVVRIILPSKVALETEATMVNVPGDEGVFGVLPGHVKLTSSIDVGVITLFSGEMETKYFVYGGVVQVTGPELNIISEFAVDLDSKTPTSVRNDITNLENDLSDAEADSIEADIISNNIKKYQSLLKFI